MSYGGVWVDHEKAYVVVHSENANRAKWIESNAEPSLRSAGGSRSKTTYGPQDISSEDRVQRRREHQFQRYYQEIIQALEDADSVWIFGPGEAKKELEKEFHREKLRGAKVVGTAARDKMSEKEIESEVHRHFEAWK